jgi:hypothetical protein
MSTDVVKGGDHTRDQLSNAEVVAIPNLSKSPSKDIQLTPLDQERRKSLPTGEMARQLNLSAQTLYGWSHYGTYPACLKPTRINKRLHWPVAGALQLLKEGA